MGAIGEDANRRDGMAPPTDYVGNPAHGARASAPPDMARGRIAVPVQLPAGATPPRRRDL